MIPERTLTSFRAAAAHGHLPSGVVNRFQKLILDYYRRHKRPLPWRATRDPYHVVVSEVMLQQTQVDRVAVKYAEFIDAFPCFDALAMAPFERVLKVWQGMGYNRRAKSLHGIAQRVVFDFNGNLPRDLETLKTLPGIGSHTAASIAAYAFNMPTVFLETNMRTVYIHVFFDDDACVHDDDLYPLVERTLDYNNPNRWYNALMDYGAMIKREIGNVSRRSRHYVKQSPFEGSNRQIRSLIIKTLIAEPMMTSQAIVRRIGKPTDVVKRILSQLIRDGLVSRTFSRFTISS